MAYVIFDSTGEAFETDSPENYKGSRKITKKEYLEARKEYCRKMLLKWLKPKSRVYTLITNRAASGMSRHVRLFVPHGSNDLEILEITAWTGDLIGYRRSDSSGGLVVGGCGFDAGFQCVYSLGASLWPDGTPEPHGTRNGEPDTSGGYALTHLRL